MLGELAVVNGERQGFSQPDDHAVISAISEFAQEIAIFAHDAFGHFHLLGEFGIEGRELDAVRQLGGIERVAFLQAQARQEFLGQDDADGMADLCDFEFHKSILTAL